MNRKNIWLIVCTLFINCSDKNYYNVPTFSEQGLLNAVIEIPAGTNTKYEFNNDSKEFEIDKKNGKKRIINFLPYPSNYGFIPSTLSKREEGGDGDALDIFVISEYLKTGTVITTIPIAMLKLIDDGEMDYKIIAVPASPDKRIITATTYSELLNKYPALIQIIELWFLNYNQDDVAIIEGWGDEKEALAEIRSSSSH